jgi:Lrp/AsnC family leucine-responsive transcriptional regulator
MGSSERIDEKDLQIIGILSDNARTSLREIEKKVDLSPSSIRLRMERLVELGVIKRYTLEIDYRKLGLEIQVLILITAKPGVSKGLQKTLSSFPQVSEVLRTVGPATFVLTVRVKDITELTHFVSQELENLNGVDRIETMLILPEDQK